MLRLDADAKEFKALAWRVVKQTKSATRNVWLETAKRFVLHATKFTPPFGSRPTKESFQVQRKIGIAAVKHDIHRLFLHLGPSAEQQVRLTKGNMRYWIDKSGRVHGIPVEQLAIKSARTVMHEFHRKHWIRGDLKSPGKSIKVGRALITNRVAAPTRNINGYANFLARRVFTAKSGWSIPARGLGLKLPKIVTKHGGHGLFTQSGFGKWPSYTIGNKVSWIQEKGRELKIIKSALFAGTAKLKKQLRKTIRKNAMKKGK